MRTFYSHLQVTRTRYISFARRRDRTSERAGALKTPALQARKYGAKNFVYLWSDVKTCPNAWVGWKNFLCLQNQQRNTISELPATSPWDQAKILFIRFSDLHKRSNFALAVLFYTVWTWGRLAKGGGGGGLFPVSCTNFHKILASHVPF